MLLLQEMIGYLRASVPIQNFPENTSLITLIDHGHGGIVNNEYTTSPSKMYKHKDFVFYEGVFNRAVAWMYAYKLYQRNLGYCIIRSSNYDTALKTRVNSANSLYYRNKDKYRIYFHSIHGNGFDDLSVRGVEVFTSPGPTPADPIATVFYNHLEGLGWKMRSDGLDGDPDKEAKLFVLMKTQMPAILTETGFYTNEEEARLMKSPDIINKIADIFLLAHMEILVKTKF